MEKEAATESVICANRCVTILGECNLWERSLDVINFMYVVITDTSIAKNTKRCSSEAPPKEREAVRARQLPGVTG
ncbi:hypothetical protein NDU88_007048 [Pleurodeles waltl]|uniref:Uncharacterized protein n=1 Tax=Pleurodeles waltl TaxID=8319 RepID=A0AAV7MHU7_PLEWA|nr:hypothetical protein NDU88_007048 [Pleurodeles waltl]